MRVIPNSWMEPILLNSKTVAPRMAGMERRKENRAKRSRSNPQKRLVDSLEEINLKTPLRF
jgi:hypothetical protein